MAAVAPGGIGMFAIGRLGPPMVPAGGTNTCQSGPADATEFVMGTTIEIVSGPVSAPAGLLSPGTNAAGVPFM